MTNNVLPVYRNRNKHVIVPLHYSADPNKDPHTVEGKAWFIEAENAYLGGSSSLGFRRELEMDWSAGSGELVFANFIDMESKILVNPFIPDTTYELYGGLDWGDNNPCAFLVLAFDLYGKCTVVWEWYQDHVPSIEAVAQAILMCPYYDRLRRIMADPTMWNENQYQQSGKTSLARIFSEDLPENLRIQKLVPAHYRSDTLMIQKMQIRWNSESVRLQISKICGNLIRELRNLRYRETRGDINNSDKIINKDNHAWDALKYCLLSHPSSQVKEDKPKYGTLGYINEIAQEAEDIAARTGQDVQDVFNDLYEVPPVGMVQIEED